MSDDSTPTSRPRKPRLKRLRFLLILFAVLLLGLISFVFGMFVAVASDLPSLTKFSQYKNEQSSILLDDLGHPIGVLSQQNRVIVTPSQIPQIVKEAVISIEDKRFETEGGIDIRGHRARVRDDIEHKGAVQGASTIEEQFIKNALQAQSHRTIFEKLREAALAYQLSHKWSKEKIITAYLNTIYFGNGAYGIEAAAQTYFGQEAGHRGCGTPGHELCIEELQPWEAALLAGIIQDPTGYDPATHPRRPRNAATWCCEQMLAAGLSDQGHLRTERRAAAARRRRTSRRPRSRRSKASTPATSRAGSQQQVIERYGAPQAFDGGLHIKTTLDLGLQRAAEQPIERLSRLLRRIPAPRSWRSKTRPARCARWSAGATTTKARSTSRPRASASRAPRSRRSTSPPRSSTASRPTRCGPPRKRSFIVPSTAATKSSSSTTTRAPTRARTR